MTSLSLHVQNPSKLLIQPMTWQEYHDRKSPIGRFSSGQTGNHAYLRFVETIYATIYDITRQCLRWKALGEYQ